MEDSDVNRRYFVHYVSSRWRPGARVLDFGSGGGTLVRMLRTAGYDAYGVDVRSGPFTAQADAHELPGLLRYYADGEPLPFADGEFDLVVSNQVFEHVVSFDAAVSEIKRVLKPGGVSYHHFPSRSVLREGHIGIPLSHRLPPGRLRLAYTIGLRRLGLGTGKDERPARAWAADKLEYIDRKTVYRSRRVIHDVMGRDAELRNTEIEYCRFRAADHRRLRAVLARPRLVPFAEAVFRLLAFEAIEVRTRGGP